LGQILLLLFICRYLMEQVGVKEKNIPWNKYGLAMDLYI
jgi:hypothetical protein